MSKIKNLNFTSTHALGTNTHHRAKFNQNRSTVCHLGFLAVKKPISHQRTKFRKDRSNRCGEFAIFVVFKMAATAILDLQKFEILTIGPL